MKTATAVTQTDPVNAQSSSDSVQVAPNPTGESTPITAAPTPSLDVRVKQVKTVVRAITKEREFKGETKTITYWEVKAGSAVSKVYMTPHGKRELFTLAYWVDGQRKREVFPSKEAAIEAARKTNKDLGSGNLTAPDILPKDRVVCVRAVEILAPYHFAIDDVASRYVKLWDLMGGKDPLIAVEDYRRRKPPGHERKKVGDVVVEMIAVKRSDKLSERYLKQLEYDLNRFADRFRNCLGDVNGRDVDTWLRDLGVGPRTRNNLRNSVKALFKFAIARKYLPKDHDEIDAVPVAKDAGGEIEIYTPDEMKELLTVASAEHVPFLAISAFAGVRHAELQRLDWSQVKQDGMIIEIKAGTAKTASRRVIPILPNLAKWLKPHWETSGAICGYANMVLQFVELTRRVNEKRRAAWAKAKGVSAEALKAADKAAEERLAKLPRNERRSRGTVMPGAETAQDEGWEPFLWKHNALRHSFISYRVAITQNVAQVALEAGNSPQMIFKHYRELVRPAAAVAWFCIGLSEQERAKFIARQVKAA